MYKHEIGRKVKVIDRWNIVTSHWVRKENSLEKTSRLREQNHFHINNYIVQPPPSPSSLEEACSNELGPLTTSRAQCPGGTESRPSHQATGSTQCPSRFHTQQGGKTSSISTSTLRGSRAPSQAGMGSISASASRGSWPPRPPRDRAARLPPRPRVPPGSSSR